VIAYAHAEAYFAPEDVTQARTALRWLLWEDVPRAEAEAAKLSPPGRARMALLFAHDTASLVGGYAAGAGRGASGDRCGLATLLPGEGACPVILLHGAADNVVPPTEMLWLEHDLAPGELRAALISPAIGHWRWAARSTMDKLRLNPLDESDDGPAGYIVRRARLRRRLTP